MNEILERLPVTPQTEEAFFQEFPDHKQRYEFALRYAMGRTVADIACGAGYGSAILAEAAQLVYGFDIDRNTVAHAQKHYGKPNCNFLHASAFAGPFDFIVSFETLEHMSEAEGDTFLQIICRNLAPQGKVLLSTPRNESSHKHNVTPYHIREYSHAELKEKLARNGFKVEAWFGQSNALSRHPATSPQVLKWGVHHLLPSLVRNGIKHILFGKNNIKARQGVTLKKNDLRGANVQIALCRRA